ncbi:MAG: restriction endonuclease [Chitinispirillales bacterium]|jgi:site-specific DNA-methyltransferase (adenine-specific)|nr:restriction endonuclease [Chitinispirillales bacterium]
MSKKKRTTAKAMNKLYYGDNLDVLRKYIADESIDLCYIDPPFNSNRDYNQIYATASNEDKAQSQAFVDTWEWDKSAIDGLNEILENEEKRFNIELVKFIDNIKNIVCKGSLLAYLISLALRVTEIHRALKKTGSFYFHCDPTASHYIKLLLDNIFVPKGGNMRNEIIWHYTGNSVPKYCLPRKHDVIFSYCKGDVSKFYPQNILIPYSEKTEKRYNHIDDEGRRYKVSALRKGIQEIVYMKTGKYSDDVWDIPVARGKEALGYPTQKPEALLERIIKASSNETDNILDAYCGCGTTVAVCERLNRKWVGIDITYQSISLIIKRLEDTYGEKVSQNFELNGIPRDIESATALALKKDDRVRKEFEKWVILTYTNNYAYINEKKGSDKGIDGRMFMAVSSDKSKEVLFSVKSGKVSVKDIRDFRGVLEREENAVIGIFITLNNPTKDMINEAKEAGVYVNSSNNQPFDRIKIITTEQIINGERLYLPLPKRDVVRQAESNDKSEKIDIDF